MFDCATSSVNTEKRYKYKREIGDSKNMNLVEKYKISQIEHLNFKLQLKNYNKK